MKIGSVSTQSAVLEHRSFVRALEHAGATVDTLPFVHGAFDSVFVKDTALIARRPDGTLDALLGSPRHAERQVEQKARARELARLGISIRTILHEATFEGGDVALLPNRGGAFLGYGFRTSVEALDDVERFVDTDVVGLELVHPRLFHLDMALSILDDGTTLYCAEAFSPSSRAAIERHRGVRSLIRVPLAEALSFGVNLVQVGRTIVWAASNAPRTTRALEAAGYVVREVALDQFQRAGGSAACLVARVHDMGFAMDEEAPHSTAA